MIIFKKLEAQEYWENILVSHTNKRVVISSTFSNPLFEKWAISRRTK